MTLGEMIYAYRTKNNLSMDDFAARSGISKGYVSMLERNYNPNTKNTITPSLSMIRKAAIGMGTTFDEVFSKLNPDLKVFMEDSSPLNLSGIKNIIPLPETKTIPLLGSIACGEPILAEENIVDLIEIPKGVNATFALTCHGDSMTGARIMDGDIVYIHEQPDVENGQIAAVLIGDEATLKKVYKYPNMLVLRPENPAYEEMVYQDNDLDKVKIIGLAVSFHSAVRHHK